MKLIISIIIILILAFLIKRSKALDNKGVIGASIMGFTLLYFCGVKYFILLLSFFILGSLVSKIGLKEKRKYKLEETQRSLKNVLANGLIPFIFALLSILSPIFLPAFTGSLSTAASDTFSSEIGVLSKEKPILITTLKPVEKGEDGAVSKLGLLAGFLGSLSIGIFSYILFNDFKLLISTAVSGFLGNLFDSILGALFERRGLIDNEITNLLATLFGGLIGILIYVIL
ncbi:protein of unknown function DUF92 transmembrane [Methanocaldococcus infernus ME]|uniref:TIGR00297 family protein n=1 Tax=Methanocaldococcus infernus (strain DSM 11812 / JCM 15783 / ME) TaxID=573063 RepID=D5VQE6_METIM|nr:TIGR00297 family protein [Methanocaldococcus infernus]ADG12799.1 protein of unknown function DUF92 transmembrane [Methanocaldococcus infernus ME]